MRKIYLRVCRLLMITLTMPMPLMVYAQTSAVDELLQSIRRQGLEDSKINQQRERQFIQQRDKQQALLTNTKQQLSALEKQRDQLKAIFNQQEKQLSKLESELHQRLGVLGELFGVARQVAGDALGEFQSSLITSQYGNRVVFVKEISKSKSLPSIEDLENLWYLLQQEVIESGRVTGYQASVVNQDGQTVTEDIVRVGAFNAFNQNGFLKYMPETGEFSELHVQPGSEYFSELDSLKTATQPIAVGVDPTRGALTALLVQLPGVWERVKHGKLVGYIILLIGVVGLFVAVYRYISLTSSLKKIQLQKSVKEISTDNPLGRVLNVFVKNKQLQPAILEKKLDEAVLQEIPHLEAAISTIKILAVIAPLLGLLGTVTGMIGTFQSITLFGSGDPKLMSSGISQALVTTVLGLSVAIPLIFLHSLVMSKCKACVLILEEQSAGIAARHAEGHQGL